MYEIRSKVTHRRLIIALDFFLRSLTEGKLFVIVFVILESGGSEAVFTSDLSQPQSLSYLTLQGTLETLVSS